MSDKVKIVIDNRLLKIYIKGTIHLIIKRKDLIGIQSWLNHEEMYFIEYTTTNQDMLTEYDDKEIWEYILNILDKENLL